MAKHLNSKLCSFVFTGVIMCKILCLPFVYIYTLPFKEKNIKNTESILGKNEVFCRLINESNFKRCGVAERRTRNRTVTSQALVGAMQATISWCFGKGTLFTMLCTGFSQERIQQWFSYAQSYQHNGTKINLDILKQFWWKLKEPMFKLYNFELFYCCFCLLVSLAS